MKRVICALLSILLLFSMAACGTQQNAGTQTSSEITGIGDAGGLKLPLTDKGETVTWAVSSSISNLDELFVHQRLEEITGVSIHIEAYPPSTVQEKVKVLGASEIINIYNQAQQEYDR